MIGSGGTTELVWVDKDNHECYVYFNLTEAHNRPFPEYEKMIPFRNPHLRWFIERIHSNQLDVQIKYIFLLSRKLAPPPENFGESDDVVMTNIEKFRVQLLRTFEQLEEDEVPGRFIGYTGMLKIKGDRVLQYNHFTNFLPQMPPNTLILRKLLEFYTEVYPLRVLHRMSIKDFSAERQDIFIGMDSEFKVVTDVVLLPLIMKNDDESVLDVSIPVEMSPFGVKIAGHQLDQYLTATVVDIEGKPPSLCMSEFSIKELRGMLMIILEICFDRVVCPVIVEYGNKIYSLVAAGVTVSRRKLEILANAYDLIPDALTLDILEVILDPHLSLDDFSERARKMIEVIRRHEQGR